MSLFSSDTKTNPYADAEKRMHHAMMEAEGADADQTFVLKMIEHHRGGIEMGQIHMEEGTDPMLHEMVNKSMAHQEKEIQELESWLRNKGR